ncbi:MAG: ferritin family protein [Aquincola sp.]|nr:ferritin family protein [Aquincola sp.]MDH4288730.1 ferritin family protein [Aquincola sp.]MDH5330348.1 ferritin family protein [Aquincola sp.]
MSSSNRQAPQTMESLMAQALLMEREAVARYTELAEMMETHNNTEVADLFRKMAEYEGHHVAQILADMDWAEDDFAPHDAGTWATAEPPESVPVDEMHYLMHPWHALQLALAAEQRAVSFFDNLVREATSDDIRRAAESMRDEELEHVALVKAWLQKVPKPGAEWAVDPDPPRYAD